MHCWRLIANLPRGMTVPQSAAQLMVHALWRVYSLRVAIGLSAGFIGGCVELPGIYYNVMLDERPSESDCVNLTDALTAKLARVYRVRGDKNDFALFSA